MGKALRYRLFGVGKMTQALREAAAGTDVLVAAEGISLKQSVSALKIPRASVASGMKLLVGAVVLCPDRVLASVGSRQILDADFSEHDPSGPLLTLTEDGVRIALDLASVIGGQASGSVQLHYRLSLPSATLAKLPTNSCHVQLKDTMPALLNGWKGTWSR